MNNPLVSIIVPVYNMEKYLDRCISSLVNQTYKNIEIILIDDGSKDNSSKICDAVATEDNRVVVFHKNNGGLSSARNAGLRIAKGELITFVDSDDWVEIDTYQYMIDVLNKTNADIVQCGFLQTDRFVKARSIKEQIDTYKNKEALQFYMNFSTKTGSYSVWKYLYKRNVLSRITFREGKINEDIDFNYKAIRNCNLLAVSNQIKYYYYQDGNSLSLGGLKKRDFDLYEAAAALYEMTEMENYGNIRELGKVKKARTAFSLLCKIVLFGISDNDIDKEYIVDKLIKEHRNNVLILITSPIPFSRKVLSALFAISYTVTEKLVKAYKLVKFGEK